MAKSTVSRTKSRFQHGTVAGMVFLAVAGVPVRAQSPQDRATLDSVLVQFERGQPVGAPLCAGSPPDVARICEAVQLLRRVGVESRNGAVRANDLAVRAVTDQDAWPYAWLVLGLVRLQLAKDTVFSQEAPGMGIGTSYELGAANAFMRALQLEPSLVLAANSLALTAEPREGARALMPRVGVLRQVRALLSPSAMAAAAIIERDAGSLDSAIALEQRALSSGAVDSGVVLLSLARDLYRAGQPDAGRSAIIRGAAIPSDAAHHAYHDELAWVASPRELAQWDSLAPGERAAWITRFWADRDVSAGLPPGARLVEHYRRVEYAMSHFRIALPQTGRQRFLTWGQSAEYAKEEQGKRFALRHPELCPETARFVADANSIGADAAFRYYQPVQDLVDDRGAIWIRHGPPTEVRKSVGGDIVEIWRYERPGGPLVLQFRAADFSGSSGAGVLVPSLLTVSPGVRNQVCELEQSLCSRIGLSRPMEPGDTTLFPPVTIIGPPPPPPPPIPGAPPPAIRLGASSQGPKNSGTLTETCVDPMARVLEREVYAEGNLLNTSAIVRARTAGRAAIDLATTTDSYQPDFAKPIHPAVDIYGLSLTTDASPRLVVTFALPGEQLAYAMSELSGGRAIYPVDVHVIASNLGDGARIDRDTVRQFAAATPLGAGQYLVGLTEVPVPPGRYHVAVVFTQRDGHGAIANLNEVAVHGAEVQLAISDVVLGREGSGIHWNSGSTSVSMNPLNTYRSGETAELYFQLSGLRPGAEFQTKLEVFRAGDDARHAARLTISSKQEAAQERMEITRSLGLRNLDAGRYRARVTVTADGAKAVAVGWLTIVK